MNIDIKYPHFMPRKHTAEVIDLFFKHGLTYEQISAKLGKHKTIAEKAVQIYMPKLSYDKDEVLDKMKKHRDSLEYSEDYKKVTGMNYNYVRGRLLNNEGLALRTQIDLCARYDVFLKVEWLYNPIGSWHDIDGVETPPEILKNRIGFTPTRKNRRSKIVDNENFTDLIDKGDRSEVKVNTTLIENYRNQIIQILQEREVSNATINRIIDKLDSIARESTLFGIHSERLGKGDTLEKSILRHITSD